MGLPLDERVLDVVAALYDAAADDTLWSVALSLLASVLGSNAATFWVLTTSDKPQLPLFTYVNLEPAFVQDYLDHVAHLDPTVQYLVAHPDHVIVHDGIVITEREKDRHPYYDWQSKYTDLRFRLVGQVNVAPGVQAGVALHRTRRTGIFEPPEIHLFSFLYKHLKQAVTLAFRLGTLGAIQQWNTDLLDAHASAVMLLDRAKRITYANRRAEALRANGDGIVLTRDRISLLHRDEDALFQGLLTEVLQRGGSAGTPPVKAMRVSRPSGRRSFGIIVSGIVGKYPTLSGLRPAACVMVNDPDAEIRLPCDLLRSAFGLTRAEADLAVRLAAGDDLRLAADRLGITYGTARTRLAEIFQKTATSRQGELIRLLLATLGGA